MEDVIVGLIAGFVGGGLAGLLGIGGGAIFVPAMSIILETEQIVAQGTSLTVIVATAAVGAWQHGRQGTVDRQVARWTIPLALAFGFVGAYVAGELDGDTLKRIFGVVVIIVAVRMLYQTWRTPAVAVAPTDVDIADPAD